MKKTISSLIFFMIFSIVHSQVVGPKISVPEGTFDFGDIVEGDVVSHEFIVHNTGGALLEITKVRASCGCTAAQPDVDKLKPGESTKIKVEFNSAKRKGNQTKYVYVFSNDPGLAQLRLSFTANVLEKVAPVQAQVNGPRLNLFKKEYNFGTVEQGQLLKTEIQFQNLGSKVLEISRVKTSCGCTAALLSKESLNPGERGTIKIELDTSDRVGKFTRTVTIHSNDVVEPSQIVNLFVNIKEKI